MTDTVNKQDAVDMLEHESKSAYWDMPARLALSAAAKMIETMPATPSTPVQGYREVLIKIRNEASWHSTQYALNICKIVDEALSQTDIQPISAKQELDIVRSAKDSLMRYTKQCRTERDYWQTRAIEAEQKLSSLKNGSGINSTEEGDSE